MLRVAAAAAAGLAIGGIGLAAYVITHPSNKNKPVSKTAAVVKGAPTPPGTGAPMGRRAALLAAGAARIKAAAEATPTPIERPIFTPTPVVNPVESVHTRLSQILQYAEQTSRSVLATNVAPGSVIAIPPPATPTPQTTTTATAARSTSTLDVAEIAKEMREGLDVTSKDAPTQPTTNSKYINIGLDSFDRKR